MSSRLIWSSDAERSEHEKRWSKKIATDLLEDIHCRLGPVALFGELQLTELEDHSKCQEDGLLLLVINTWLVAWGIEKHNGRAYRYP